MNSPPNSTPAPATGTPCLVPSRCRRERTTPLPPWLVLPLLLLTACGGDGRSATADEAGARAPAVEAVQAVAGSLPREERLSGVIKARNQVAIRPEISAPVVEVLVASGESVRRGQALVRLDATTLRDQLRQADAAVRLAEAEARGARARVAELEAQVTRTRALAAEELVSPLQVETQEARLEAARAEAARARARVEQVRATVEERRTAIAKAVVRAPVAGRVGQRDVEVGMQVDPGSVLFLIGDLDRVRVEVPLTEGMLSYIEEGQPARITADALAGEPLLAELSRISPFLEEGSFSTVGEIDLVNLQGDRARRLRPGMFVTVDILHGQSEEATLVPTSALWEDPRSGVEGIYVVAGMSGVEPPAPPEPASETGVGAPLQPVSEEALPVELRPVVVLAEGQGRLGVRGIEPGEWVVTVGQQLLTGDESPSTRVRPISWARVLAHQGLQREDLLEGFLERQRRAARERGAEIPSSREYLTGDQTGDPNGELKGAAAPDGLAPDDPPSDSSTTSEAH